MKKILLIGDYNNTLDVIYKALENSYNVQLCRADYAEVDNLLKMINPHLVLISFYGVSQFDKNIFELIKNTKTKIPTIYVGTQNECKNYLDVYNEKDEFYFIERPTTQKNIYKKCCELLALSDGGKKEKGKEALSANKKKILVVDDSGVFLRAAKSILEPKYETILAKSGEKALSIVESGKIDLILLDYEMSGMDGRETLIKLREKESTANIPVVFLTAVSDRSNILEVLKLQPQGYILKPIDEEKLENKIKEVFQEETVI